MNDPAGGARIFVCSLVVDDDAPHDRESSRHGTRMLVKAGYSIQPGGKGSPPERPPRRA